MKSKKPFPKADRAGFMLGVALLGTLMAGCVGYVESPRQGSVQVEPDATFAAQDDYVYYPQYECYYSVSRHRYAYREGNAWVARPAPRGVSPEVLRASPSMKMDFHDSPAQHHATVVRQYPKNWSPAGAEPGQKDKRKDDKRDDRGENNNGKKPANDLRAGKGILCWEPSYWGCSY